MSSKLDLAPDLMARVDALAARTTMTREEIVRDALENGRSLVWLEEWVASIEEGLAAAERGDFATDEEMELVLGKHRRT